MSEDLISPELETAAIAAAQAAQNGAAPPPAPAPPPAESETQTSQMQQASANDEALQAQASVRARQQSQRLREATRSEAELTARARQEVEAEKAAIATAKRELAENLELIKKDPAAFLKRHEIPVESLIKAKWEENKDGYRLSQQEKDIAELREKLTQREQAEKNAREAQDVEATQVAFIKTATDAEAYPHISAWYDDANDLIRDAYAIQEAFTRQFGHGPTKEEIAMNLDAQLKERYARMKGRQEPGDEEAETPAPANVAPVPKKRSLPATSKVAPSAAIDRSKLSDEDLEQLATKEAQKVIDQARRANGAG